MKFLEHFSESLIFTTYSSALIQAGDSEFSQFDAFNKDSFYRLKFLSIESRISPNSVEERKMQDLVAHPQDSTPAADSEARIKSAEIKIVRLTETY